MMNKIQLFSVAIKYITLVIGLNTFSQIISLIFILNTPSDKSGLGLFLGYQRNNTDIILRLALILIYSAASYFLFKKSDEISKKLIKDKVDNVATKEEVMQMVVAFGGFFGIITSLLDILHRFFMDLRFIEVGGFSKWFVSSAIWVYLVSLFINLLFLLYYERVSKFLISKIPNRFWPK